MTDLNLEPFSARIHFLLEAPMPSGQWQKILARYMEALARRCEEAGPCVIGHIKAVALFSENRYLRISVVSSSHPAEIGGKPPEIFNELNMTLNVLVYGLSRPVLHRLVKETAAAMETSFKGRISVAPVGLHVIR
jgi:hypothetical protein